jgi:hypothetical protein
LTIPSPFDNESGVIGGRYRVFGAISLSLLAQQAHGQVPAPPKMAESARTVPSAVSNELLSMLRFERLGSASVAPPNETDWLPVRPADTEFTSTPTFLAATEVYGGEVVEPKNNKIFHPERAVVPANKNARRTKDDASYDEVVAVGEPGRWHCSGVQVGSNLVLTAAHCLPATSIATGHNLAVQRHLVSVRSSELAPEGLDAALLVLEENLSAASATWRDDENEPPPRGDVTIVGFGATDTRGTAPGGVMMRAALPVRGWGCDSQRELTMGCRAGREMILRSPLGRDTCDGDSGGPVFESYELGRRLLAIASRPLPGGSSRCGHGGIYVRVDVLSQWLSEQMTLQLDQPKNKT